MTICGTAAEALPRAPTPHSLCSALGQGLSQLVPAQLMNKDWQGGLRV